ncbi:CDP-6-deoxy-L-threo-D-glycero-4-hexulose-3-dehydrase reductase [Kingella potus]|uniref:CDP-6-deoxy-L-threo-D-glycero-4-hexulose-3-dehydr ase reductase n=1 Tax=Kingella potus TaxID=265175 RepID=A0A377QZ32_9NEIS|nr:2Fe-2S iron-sulfur cluster-binding protein [Kingella potus]UOP01580.1 2Fe-2S iron-sulfur cluster-binding protein [Kingella potus]STR00129.1 CDP-6-deoxy-L-threo-D-glycero-4-hexulose-3-dehydrase reductase [Kingella potus]
MNHTITLSPDNETFEADEGESILAAARRQGFNLPHSCQAGICGQCKAEVLSGRYEQGEHAEQALPAEEAAQNKILMCCCYAQSGLELKVPGYNSSRMPPVKSLPARVAAVDYIGDTAVVRLDMPKKPAFVFLAGQYIDILLKDGHTRSYSLAGSSAHTEQLELHIRKRDGGLFSSLLFGSDPAIKEKTVMRVRGPMGTFVLQEDSTAPLILLATGTGFAPVQSILHRLAEQDSSRTVRLYWGGRTLEELYYHKQAAELAGRLKNACFIPVLSRADDSWQGARGYVWQQVLRDCPDLSASEVYACGSPAMIRDAQQALVAEGRLKADAFFADAFLPAQ